MNGRREPNTALRDVIAAAGWSYEAAAGAVRRVGAENGEALRTNKSAVAHWIAGARPSGRTATYLAEALARRLGRPVTLTAIGLGAQDPARTPDGDPVAESVALGHADLDRRRFLLAAAFTTAGVAMPLTYDHEDVSRMLRARATLGAVGAEEVDVVRQVTAALAAADERLGGGHALTTVTAYLADTAAPLLRCRFPSDDLRRSAFGAAAELAHLAGWKHHDLGHEGAAQRYYMVGYRLACESDPRGHRAWMMRALANQALSLKQPQYCAELAERALGISSGHLDGGTRALLHITHARAHARLGERAGAARALLAAEDALSAPASPQPSFSAATGPAAGTVASHTARTLTDLGDHKQTERKHRKALRTWDRDRYRRVHILTHADLGDCLAAQGRADEAIDAWSRSLDLAGGVASGRAREAMSSIAALVLTYKRRRVPGSVELHHRIVEFCR